MKTLRVTKKVVIATGILSLVVAVIGAVNDSLLIALYFPVHAGISLRGTALLHKEETTQKSLR